MIDNLEADLKEALLKGDSLKVSVLRSIKNEYANYKIAHREKGLNAQQKISILRKLYKQRQEAAQLYRQGGAVERAEKEEAEARVIKSYLPPEIDEGDLKNLVDKAIDRFGADTGKMGQIIAYIMRATKGAADGKTVADLVRQRLK